MTIPEDSNGSQQTGSDTKSDPTGAQNVVPKGANLVVNVYKTAPGADTASPEAVCDVGNSATFQEKDLGQLRQYLNSMKILKPIE